MTETCDVAIVGAGPAGAWTAFRLARAGASVTLFDPSHPREKACGGGLTGRALALVSDAPGIDRLPAVDVRAVRFTDRSHNTPIAVPLGRGTDDSIALRIAARRDFDGLLFEQAEAAGGRVVRDRVTAVATTKDGARVQTRRGMWSARWIVGADGANSLVRRQLGHAFSRRDLSIATGYYAHGVTAREVTIEIVDDPPGYLWSFPRVDHLAVGICAQADATVSAAALRARAAAWIEQTGIAPDARLEPYSWAIPSLTPDGWRSCTFGGDRWCLVGDAAGLVDPITREGLYFALASAEHAAASVLGPDPGPAYSARLRAEIVSELERAARLKAGFFAERFATLLMQALRQSPRVREVMADLIAGQQPYGTLRRRLLRTREFGLAWRFLKIWRG